MKLMKLLWRSGLSYLVIKVCFSPALRTQAKLPIGQLVSVVPETSSRHGQYQQSSHHCHGDQRDDRPARPLRDPGDLGETPRICSLVRKHGEETHM